MEKYGVLEDPAVTKTAEEKREPKRCPECDSELIPTDQVNVYKCPKCGTKPFER